MDNIYFSEPLPGLILKGEKTSTWRIDEPVPYRKSSTENIKAGDTVSLCYSANDKEFAKAIVTKVVKKTFGEMDEADMEGHKKFASEKEMYDTFSSYYNIRVTEKTKVKIIRFEIVE